MLRHLGEQEAAWKIRNALDKVYRTRDKLTRDIGGKAGTSQFADAVVEAMESKVDAPHAMAEPSHL
jgi:isocitrate dehydrogenase (NAD+)